MSQLVIGMGIIAIVLTVSALASGLVERAPAVVPYYFLRLGLFVGRRWLKGHRNHPA